MDPLTAPVPLRINSSALSDVGLKRTSNEDALLEDRELGVYAVADGMGGHLGGEVASRMAIEMLREAAPSAPDRAYRQTPSVANRRLLLDWLTRTAESINTALLLHAEQNPKLRGMGCTLDVALIRGGGLFFAHIGDSRIYALRRGVLYQLTEDHSLEQALLAGGMSAEEVARHPQRKALTRALGPFPTIQVDTSFLELSAGDLFLLCSDGLHGEVPTERIRELLAAGPERAAPQLVQAALASGGRDNVSVVTLSVDACPACPLAVIGSEAARAALLRSPLFEHLTEPELLRVQKIAAALEVAAGETVLAAGELADTLFVIVDGAVTVVRDSHPVATLGSGDPFGTMSLDERPSEVTVVATAATRLLCFALADVRRLFSTDPAIAAKLALGVLERLARRLAVVSAGLARYRQAAQQLVALELAEK